MIKIKETSMMSGFMTQSFPLIYCLIVGVIMPLTGAGWIDPDTERAVYSSQSLVDQSEYKLVFSDEFNVDNRNFADGKKSQPCPIVTVELVATLSFCFIDSY